MNNLIDPLHLSALVFLTWDHASGPPQGGVGGEPESGTSGLSK
jgi:hypothetical protein